MKDLIRKFLGQLKFFFPPILGFFLRGGRLYRSFGPPNFSGENLLFSYFKSVNLEINSKPIKNPNFPYLKKKGPGGKKLFTLGPGPFNFFFQKGFLIFQLRKRRVLKQPVHPGAQGRASVYQNRAPQKKTKGFLQKGLGKERGHSLVIRLEFARTNNKGKKGFFPSPLGATRFPPPNAGLKEF